ncbi:hypothetical protein V7183_19550 [Bacillus sp. JJ1127]|uniref:hypothetical protein n=1 Tax=Bacillus sp. JJ1127 TaxID=3122952 RepID=UPI002FFD9827
MNFNVELPQSLKEMIWNGWILLGVIVTVCIALVIITSYIPETILRIVKGVIAIAILGVIFYIAY